jgi:EAL domain-containing protein (putative c-di-GMP-specific phosphodiesterase class I)
MAPASRLPRLLVIDDERAICELIGDVATAVGFEVQTASNLEEIELVVGRGHDIVMLDLHLGGPDGISVMKTLAARAPGSRVVLVSGASDRIIASADRVAQMYGLEVLATCQKPFSLTQLRGILEDCRASALLPQEDGVARPSLREVLADLVIPELTMAYQPVVRLSDGKVVGAEALVRWTHPNFGSVSPVDFVPYLERTGRSRELLTQVASEVARERSEFASLAALDDLAINVSARDLSMSDTPDLLREILTPAAPAAAWTLELTESAAYGAAVSALDVMTRLSLMYFALSIDDFGTGSSTIDRLRFYPFTTLKIDRSFITANSIHSADDWIIVETAVEMGHRLGLAVTAEGVENEPVLARLKELGCDRVQGYLVSRPVGAADFGVACDNWSAINSISTH